LRDVFEMLGSFIHLGGGSAIGDNSDMKKSKMDGKICMPSEGEGNVTFFFSSNLEAG
jgi:hypothetical protein